MKKIFSILAAIAVSATMLAADLELSLANLGTTAWEGATASNGVVTFTKSDWSEGIGWWIGGDDWSAYNAVVMEFEAFSDKIALVVEYGDESTSNGYEQVIANAGATQVRVPLDATKKSQVQKIYIQAGKMGRLTVTRCYVQGGDDPYSITGLTGVVFDFITGDDGTVYTLPAADLDNYSDADVFEVTINCTDPDKLKGYGIGKVIACGDWYDETNTIFNKIDGVGQSNYYYTLADLKKIGYKGGSTWYNDPEQGAGVQINMYGGEVLAIKAYRKSGSAVENVETAMKAMKVVENGQVYIIKNGVRYNMLGAVVK